MENNNLNNEEVNNVINEESGVETNILNNGSNENNKSKKILIVIIVVIILFLLALTIYVVVDKKDNNVNNGNNNQQIETEKDESMASLTIDLDGGTDNVDYKEKYKVGEEIELEIPTREGYKFVKWSIDGGNLVENNLIMYRDTTIKALWREINGKINYEIKETIDLYVNNKKQMFLLKIILNRKLVNLK